MPRRKDYSEEVVLAKAMIAFWEAGMKGVTTRDLSEAMGINQYSVYASFTSKQDLFARALEYYYEKFVEKGMGRPLLKENAGIEDLQVFLNQFTTTQNKKYPLGCFICNTMIEDTKNDKRIQKVIDRYRNFILTAFQKIIENEHPKEDKEYSEKKSQILYGSLLGLIVQKKQGISGEPVSEYIEEMMQIAR